MRVGEEVALMHLDDLPAEAQSDPAPFFFGGKERHEDLVEQLGRDAGAVVGDLDLQFSL